MGVSNFTILGPYVKITKGIETTEKTCRNTCPNCNAERGTKFCHVCGAEVITKCKEKKRNLETVQSIFNHIGYADDSTLYFLVYGDNIIFPNYKSPYVKHLNYRDDQEFSSKDLISLRKESMSEMQEKGKELFDLLDKFGVEYVIDHGISIRNY